MKYTGWHNESKRHSLARQGIKTGGKITDTHKILTVPKSVALSSKEKVNKLVKLMNSTGEGGEDNVFSDKDDSITLSMIWEVGTSDYLSYHKVGNQWIATYFTVGKHRDKSDTTHYRLLNREAVYEDILKRIGKEVKDWDVEGFEKKDVVTLKSIYPDLKIKISEKEKEQDVSRVSSTEKSKINELLVQTNHEVGTIRWYGYTLPEMTEITKLGDKSEPTIADVERAKILSEKIHVKAAAFRKVTDSQDAERIKMRKVIEEKLEKERKEFINKLR